MSPRTFPISYIPQYYSSNATFKDPINYGQGPDELKLIFEDLFKQLSDISLKVHDIKGDDKSAFLFWTMHYRLRRKNRELLGITYATFAEDGKVTSQIDQWDASESIYGEFPGLGLVLRSVRRFVQVCPK